MRCKLKIIITTLYLAAAIFSTAAQGLSSSKSKIVEYFFEYYKHGIDEKLYLQTDKPYLYSAADTMWFKGYLVNAITHTPLKHSNYIYVQFIDKDGFLVDEIKVKRQEETGFSGYIPLDAELTPGNYSIRAYTKWMAGGDHDLFFEKRIKVISPINDYLTKSKEELRQQEREERQAERQAEREATRKTKKLDYDIQFFPEGGSLTAGVMQNIAFKAQAEDGLSIEVRGYIYNSDNVRIGSFESTNLGMGNIKINVPHDSQYYIRATSSEGLTKKFKLPRANIENIGLSVSQVGEYLYYQPVTGFPLAVTTLRAIVHSRGRIVTVDESDMRKVHRIPINSLYDGVNVVSLIDRKGNHIAERVFFKKPTTLPQIEIETDRTNYAARKMVSLSLNVKDGSGAPAQGEFAISVVDDNVVEADSTSDNAISYLLLSSEIKGRIEKPALYFADNSRQTQYNLDLLMMTQGWRRFDIAKVIDPKVDHTRSAKYEDIVNITGRVKGFWGNKAKGAVLSVLSEELPFYNIYYLDHTDQFNIKDLDVPAKTNFTLRVKSRLNSKYLTLKVDKEELPISQAAIFNREKEVTPFPFINQSMEQFFYSGDMRLIELQEVNIQSGQTDTTAFMGKPDHINTREELRTFRKKPFKELIWTYPDMEISNDSVYFNGGRRAIRFIVNGEFKNCHDVALLTLDMIERTEFREQYALSNPYDASSGSDTGIFYITLVSGAIMPSVEDMRNTIIYAPLGYQQSRVFYHPTYDTPYNPDDITRDYRTTIFWSSAIIPDEEGNASVEFYTADKPTTYRVTVEGVTTSGEVCHAESYILRDE